MQTILIDTDIAIDFLCGIPSARSLIVPYWEQQLAYLSLLSIFELHASMREKEVVATNNFISACQIEPLTLEISEKAGIMYKHFRRQGVTLTSIDWMIAATAKVKKHLIATRNIKHYPDKSLLLKSEVKS